MKTLNCLILTVIALAVFTVSTATVQAVGYWWVTNNGTITITGYTGPGGDVTIPENLHAPLELGVDRPCARRLGRPLPRVKMRVLGDGTPEAASLGISQLWQENNNHVIRQS